MELKYKCPLIICLCGKARCGKSLVSKYISDYYINDGKKVIISPYTKYLKKYIMEITNKDIDEDNKPRDMLQKLSSELIKGKLENKDFYSYFFDVIIIPDVRFAQEIEVLRNKYSHVITIGVKRVDFDNNLTIEQKNDITETALDNYNDYDYVLINKNDKTLYDDTLKIIKEMGKKVEYE